MVFLVKCYCCHVLLVKLPMMPWTPKYVEQECKSRDPLGDHVQWNTVLQEKVKSLVLNSRKWCSSTGWAQFMGSVFTSVRLKKVKIILFLWWYKPPHCGLCSIFWHRGARTNISLSFVLFVQTQFRKATGARSTSDTVVLPLSSSHPASHLGRMSWDMSLPDVLTSTGSLCHSHMGKMKQV